MQSVDRFRRSRTTTLLAACALAAVTACAEDEALGTDESALISDHAHGNGRPGFYWLAPLVPPPNPTGTFEGRVRPVVRIDRINPATGATLGHVVTFDTQHRVHGAKVRRNLSRGYYIVRWRTDRFDLRPSATYRIRVLVEGRELGFADVDVVRNRNEARNVDRDEYVPLQVDSTLPIKFRIETRAIDRDGDGLADWRDNCPDVPNGPGAAPPPGPPHAPPGHCNSDSDECDPDEDDGRDMPAGGQLDTDHDGIGDACECTNVTCAPVDACHAAGVCQSTTGTCTSPPLADGDNDGVCDAIDSCPLDPTKTDPGTCGCGELEQPGCGEPTCPDPTADSDGDGTGDCTDGCRFDPAKTAAGVCGCGLEDVDGDVDGFVDCLDPCPGDGANTCAVECVAQGATPAVVPVGVPFVITIDLLGDEVLSVAPDGSIEVIPSGGGGPVSKKLDAFYPMPPPHPAFLFTAGAPGTVRLELTPSQAGGYLTIIELSGEDFATACVSSPVAFEAIDP